MKLLFCLFFVVLFLLSPISNATEWTGKIKTVKYGFTEEGEIFATISVKIGPHNSPCPQSDWLILTDTRFVHISDVWNSALLEAHFKNKKVHMIGTGVCHKSGVEYLSSFEIE